MVVSQYLREGLMGGSGGGSGVEGGQRGSWVVGGGPFAYFRTEADVFDSSASSGDGGLVD